MGFFYENRNVCIGVNHIIFLNYSCSEQYSFSMVQGSSGVWVRVRGISRRCNSVWQDARVSQVTDLWKLCQSWVYSLVASFGYMVWRRTKAQKARSVWGSPLKIILDTCSSISWQWVLINLIKIPPKIKYVIGLFCVYILLVLVSWMVQFQ